MRIGSVTFNYENVKNMSSGFVIRMQCSMIIELGKNVSATVIKTKSVYNNWFPKMNIF